MKAENVLQPSLVTKSAFTLATEVVRMILKIDDVVLTARWLCLVSIFIIFKIFYIHIYIFIFINKKYLLN